MRVRSSTRKRTFGPRLRREDEGWRISDRVHTLDWSCRIPTDYAVTLAQRVSALPDRP